MMGLLKADFMKLKRTWVFWLMIMAPICLIGTQVINYVMRGEELKAFGWMGLLASTNFFLPFTLLLGITVVVAMFANIEHDSKGWKQLFSLPISKVQVYLSKFVWINLCFLIPVVSLVIGLSILGVWIGFQEPIPWKLIIQEALYPYLASLPVVSIQLWLSMGIKNQAIPITVGSLGAMVSLFVAYSDQKLLQTLPWAYPPLASPVNETNYTQWPVYGVILGLIFLLLGSYFFSKRDLV